MHYNSAAKRARIEEEYRQKGVELYDTNAKLAVYINLCIHPYKWEWVYDTIRTRGQIPDKCYYAMLGAIYGVMINIKRAKRESAQVSNEIAPDIIDFIRNDKTNDPWRFILSMRRYLPRYIILRGLSTFGINWREVATEVMGARQEPQPKTYHSLLTNLYVRTLIKALGVFVAVRDENEQEYEYGVNDVATLLARESNSTKCKSKEALENTYFYLREALPSWNCQTRGRVAFYLSNLLPLSYLTEKQLYGRLHENTIGTKNER
jgi:hypothetical protein